MLYSKSDKTRVQDLGRDPDFSPEQYRTDWRRDYARLIHSPSFRRLQGKTQLFPGHESDFFRNRLTHSLEVAQIAKSLAIKLNHDFEKSGEGIRIDLDLVEFAGLAHDLGHPPFGHFGEEVLDKNMIDYGGFEGNAQTLRILAKTEKRHPEKGNRIGLNLTARTLASILKYDYQIPHKKNNRKEKNKPEKGYYTKEKKLVDFIKKNVSNNKFTGKFKTIECQIMDIADDIAYSTYDLEDSFKAGFLKPLDLICADDDVIKKVVTKVNKLKGVRVTKDDVRERIKNVFFNEFKLEDKLKDVLDKDQLHWFSITFANNMSNLIAEDPYNRINLTSKLVGSAIREVNIKTINKEIPALSKVELNKDKRIDVEILKNLIFESQIMSPKILIEAYRSKEIVQTIFDTLTGKEGYMLLPDFARTRYKSLTNKKDRQRLVCDFIAGMTDRYALEFYGRLTSENPQTIFKPL